MNRSGATNCRSTSVHSFQIMKRDILGFALLTTLVFGANAKTAKQFIENFPDIPYQPATTAHKAPELHEDAGEDEQNIAGDYDFCYYWTSMSGETANTWDTDKYIEFFRLYGNEYRILNLFRESFISDSSEGVAEITAHYDPEEQTLTIPGNQYLFDYTNNDRSLAISVMGMAVNDKGYLRPNKDVDIRFKFDGIGYSLDPTGDAQGLFLGIYYEASDSYAGFGYTTDCAFYNWNGTMIYSVAAGEDGEAIPYTCNVKAKVDWDTLTIANFADFGYTHNNTFTINRNSHTVSTVNASLQQISWGDDEIYDLYASNTSDSRELETDDDGDYLWSALYSISSGATMLYTPYWGAYLDGSPIAYYTNTYTILNFDITEQLNGVENVTADAKAPIEYYDIMGNRIEKPIAGRIVIKRQGSKVEKILVK